MSTWTIQSQLENHTVRALTGPKIAKQKLSKLKIVFVKTENVFVKIENVLVQIENVFVQIENVFVKIENSICPNGKIMVFHLGHSVSAGGSLGCFTKTLFQKKKLFIPSRLPIGHI